MGRRVVAAVLASEDCVLAGAFARPGSASLGIDAGILAGAEPCGVMVSAVAPGCFCDVDVVVDFSLPAGTLSALDLLDGTALVSGVTGGEASLEAGIARAADSSALLVASNFSTGVHVLAHLVGVAARALPDYDVEVVEAHHRRKLDAPSGTAWFLGAAAAKARGQDVAEVALHGRSGRAARGGEIGFHALRAGDVVGEHTVWLAGEGERLLLGHVATSRDTFAQGALRAARWISGRPSGRYDMADVLGLDAAP
jgi:4-hydroxy-tetrahydrodipicolinate reductase